MKHKVLMMGLAMIAGVPHAVSAKNLGKEGATQSYASWSAPHTPHYGPEGATRPLMDHLSAPVSPAGLRDNTWRMGLAPPVAVSRTDDPLTARDKRVGVVFRLDF